MFSRKLLAAPCFAIVLAAGLPEWISTIEVRTKLEEIFYSTVTFGANTLAWRRPPRETRPALTQQIQQTPADAQLYYLRAREAEAQLDFSAAEADWSKYAALAPDRASGWREKAGFHQRRAEPEKELAVLLELAKIPAAGPDALRPTAAQQSWLALERAESVVTDHLLPDDRALAVHRAREARYPKEQQTYTRFAQWLLARQRWAEVEALIGRAALAFPGDEAWPLMMRAAVERGHAGPPAAAALYDRSYQPSWPDALLTAYFRVLDEAAARRAFVDTARQRFATDPASLDAASRLFHHYRLTGDSSAAQRILHDLNKAHAGRWSPEEQLLLGRFHAAVQNHEEAARRYHAASASNDPAAAERGLSALIELLVQQAAQPFRFGGGDLSFYRDIATLDTNPGFWNGILSLVLNGQSPAAELGEQERKAVGYFHRAAAAELLRVFDTRFPRSARRGSLHAAVIEASALHAEADRVVRLGTAFLAAFPSAPERTRVALLTADAHARLRQTQPEFALYDALLNELAANSGRVPVGENIRAPRNVEYPRVLDRYIARLVAMRQPAQALALYRREIDRNPNDPGLYERLAAFLEQNRMTAEIEATYRRAIQQFPDKTWSHKLARFFLRRKMSAQFDQYTREIAAVFSGTELAAYLQVSSQQGALDPVLYRQINLYAYRRFPHHMPFVRNLLAAYANRATADPVEWERLLRANWMYDDYLRSRFFEYLSRTRKLDAELAALQSQTNTSQAAALWVAEAETWKGHFETAAPLLTKLAADFPADTSLVARAASIHRSLASWDPAQLDTAIKLEETLARAHPADAAILTRLGEMEAERERFGPAATYWDRIIGAAPGRSASYLETATLHWDYYQYADALRRIADARGRLHSPRLFAFEAGAIYENQGDLAAAAREYVAGAIDEGTDSNSRRRLIRVASRPAWRQPVDAALGALNHPAQTLALRVSLLESQSRRADIEALLAHAIPSAAPALLSDIRAHARRSGLTAVERRVLEREYSLASHPAARMAALAERMRFEESANNPAAAAQAADTLLRDHPRSLGAIRTAVNHAWRSGRRTRAAEILLASAPNAYPALQRSFRLEAIRKLTEAGEFARAHAEAAPLLAADPIDEQLVALKADAFARAKDDRALTAFYRDTVAAVQRSPLPGAARATRLASLRRAWIPALVRLNDSPGAADQYIELLKQYPEDEALQSEAARFALGSGQRARITAYFAKAESDSPRDARWPLIRARLENEFGDYSAALAAWGRAVALRPERVDLLGSRARLEERLSQFDTALASYRKLYEISFRNPAWLADGARILARQGKAADCVRWLREAYVDNRPAMAANHIPVAERLLDWGFAEQARAELQNVFRLADANTDIDRAAAALARAHATLRQLDTLAPALNAAAAAMTPEPRAAYQRRWLRQAASFAGPLYTPEEKQRFAVWLDAQRGAVDPETLASAALQAGVPESAAHFYHEAMLAAPSGERASEYLEQLIRLQSQRQQFAELGRQLEAYHRVYPNNSEKASLLQRARHAYHAAGDDNAELRLLNALDAAGAASSEERERLFELATRRVPAAVSPRQAQNAGFMDALANYALRAGKPPIAAQAIANRRSPLWQNAHRALTGLYFAENTPVVRKAFLDSLGPERIGDKLALAGNRDTTLAGDVWFSYAGRYGAWLQMAGDPNSPHYLAALVERRYNSASAYLALGEESGGAAAERAFQTALTLDEHLPAAWSRLAAIAAARGDRAAAAAHYRRAVDELRWSHDNRRIEEWFWSESARAFREAAAAGLAAEIREPAEALLRTYVKRNGAYRIRELLEGALVLAGDASAGVEWVARIARSAGDPAGFLAQLNNEGWLPAEGRETLLKLQVDLALEQFTRATGDDRAFAQEVLETARIRYAAHLLQQRKPAPARPIVEALLTNPEIRERFDLLELRLQLAALENRIAAFLPDLPPDPEQLRSLGASLRRAGFADAARAVLTLSYETDLRFGNAESAIPGLAALHLEAGAPERALPLFDTYVMQPAVPFARHAVAGRLLLDHQRKAEAVRYLTPLAAAEPWNRTARAMLAEAREDDAALAAIAADAMAPYADRLRAAQWIGANRARSIQSGAGELDLLASGPVAAPAAEQPLWAAARRAAARSAADNPTRIRLYRGVLAVDVADDESLRSLFRLLAQSGRPREAISALAERTYILTSAEDRLLLAAALVRAGQLQRALDIYDIGLADSPPPDRQRWQSAAAIARAQADRDEQNQRRRPLIGAELEQPNVVRPRLAAPQGGAR
jgi:cellulose synthase operon protein C